MNLINGLRALLSGMSLTDPDTPEVRHVINENFSKCLTNETLHFGEGFIEEQNGPDRFVSLDEDEIQRMSNAAGGSGGGATGFWAEITGSSTTAHSWVEQQQTGTNTFQDLPGGRSGTTSVDPAYEVNRRAGVPAGTIVWIDPTTDDNGTIRYNFDLGAGTTISSAGASLSPKDLREAAEGASTADMESWSISSQGSDAGVQVRVTTRVMYDDTADTPTIFGFYRDLTFDANGHLTAVGVEVRYIIDIPEECP